MTMPHLSNCAHSANGWCLACVKALWDQKEEVEQTLQAVHYGLKQDGVLSSTTVIAMDFVVDKLKGLPVPQHTPAMPKVPAPKP